MIPTPIRDVIEHGIIRPRVGDDVSYCIAGGWAACPALADDMDLWILGVPAEEHAEVVARLKSSLEADFGPEFVEIPFSSSYIGNKHLISRVGKCYVSRTGWMVHVLVTDAPDAKSLVNDFDVSTHAIAITSEGDVVKADKWTSITEPPVKLRETPTTDARMLKIEARYAHKETA